MKLLIMNDSAPVLEKYRTFIAERCPDLAIETSMDNDKAEALLPDADIFMSFGAALKRDVFKRAARLKWVQAMGTGLDGIVDAPSLGKEVIVTATRGIHGPPMSEAAFVLMLGLSRKFPQTIENQKSHKWHRYFSSLLYGKTVGILGLGGIAEALAPRCKAFGMTVVGISRTARDIPGFDRVVPRTALTEVVGSFDYFVLLIPLEADTRGIVSAEVIAAMKPTAFLVNIARGGVLDEAALLAALKAGKLAGAGLDAFQQEPLGPDSPLWDAPNVIVTPHMAGAYDTYQRDAADQFAFNYGHFKAGRPEAMMNVEPRG